jgi:hypothetical protein
MVLFNVIFLMIGAPAQDSSLADSSPSGVKPFVALLPLTNPEDIKFASICVSFGFPLSRRNRRDVGIGRGKLGGLFS